MSVIFLDDFNRANSTTVGNGWIKSEWTHITVANNRLESRGGGTIYRDMPSGSTLDVSVVAYGSESVVVQFMDPALSVAPGYSFSTTGQGITLRRMNTNGVSTLLGSAPVGQLATTAKTFRLTLTDTQVLVSVDGSAVMTVTDSIINRSSLTRVQLGMYPKYDGKWGGPDGEEWISWIVGECYADNFTIYGTATEPTQYNGKISDAAQASRSLMSSSVASSQAAHTAVTSQQVGANADLFTYVLENGSVSSDNGAMIAYDTQTMQGAVSILDSLNGNFQANVELLEGSRASISVSSVPVVYVGSDHTVEAILASLSGYQASAGSGVRVVPVDELRVAPVWVSNTDEISILVSEGLYGLVDYDNAHNALIFEVAVIEIGDVETGFLANLTSEDAGIATSEASTEAGFSVEVQPVVARAGVLASITDLVTRVLGVVRSTLLGLTQSKPGSTGLSIGRNTELERRRSSKYR